MSSSTTEKIDELVLIVAPTGRDAELTRAFLQSAEMNAQSCRDMSDLVLKIDHGCGAILLAEEALGATSVQALAGWLAKQPSWSEIPICIITSGGEAGGDTLRMLSLFNVVGNVTVLERPFRPATLVNSMQVALRSRRRQYQVRDLLNERTALAQRFRLMAEMMPQKIAVTLPNGEVEYYNHQWIDYTGLSFEETKGTGWKQVIHPDDLEETVRRWNSSVETGQPFEMEHRFRRKDGVYRWHLSRARAIKDADGGAILNWIASNLPASTTPETGSSQPGGTRR